MVDSGTRVLPVLLLLGGLAACSSGFYSLQEADEGGKIAYVFPGEREAFEFAYDHLDRSFPNRGTIILGTPWRGYQKNFHFGMDSYSQIIRVVPVRGIDHDGRSVDAFSFEISGSGGSRIGRNRNLQFVRDFQAALKASGRAVALRDVQHGEYRLAEAPSPQAFSRLGMDLDSRLDALERLRKQGRITPEEYRSQRQRILDEL